MKKLSSSESDPGITAMQPHAEVDQSSSAEQAVLGNDCDATPVATSKSDREAVVPPEPSKPSREQALSKAPKIVIRDVTKIELAEYEDECTSNASLKDEILISDLIDTTVGTHSQFDFHPRTGT